LRRPPESAQYVSIKYTERLAEAGIEPSVGSVGDSYDNALAETTSCNSSRLFLGRWSLLSPCCCSVGISPI
jgi:hypothetical protein